MFIKEFAVGGFDFQTPRYFYYFKVRIFTLTMNQTLISQFFSQRNPPHERKYEDIVNQLTREAEETLEAKKLQFRLGKKNKEKSNRNENSEQENCEKKL